MCLEGICVNFHVSSEDYNELVHVDIKPCLCFTVFVSPLSLSRTVSLELTQVCVRTQHFTPPAVVLICNDVVCRCSIFAVFRTSSRHRLPTMLSVIN